MKKTTYIIIHVYTNLMHTHPHIVHTHMHTHTYTHTHTHTHTHIVHSSRVQARSRWLHILQHPGWEGCTRQWRRLGHHCIMLCCYSHCEQQILACFVILFILVPEVYYCLSLIPRPQIALWNRVWGQYDTLLSSTMLISGMWECGKANQSLARRITYFAVLHALSQHFFWLS